MKFVCKYCNRSNFTSKSGLTLHEQKCKIKHKGKIKPKSDKIEDKDIDHFPFKMDKVDADLIYKKIRRQLLYDMNKNNPIGIAVVNLDYTFSKKLLSLLDSIRKG